MRYLLTTTLALLFSTNVLAQDNLSTSSALTQTELDTAFTQSASLTEKNLLSKEEIAETTGGSSCAVFIGGDGEAVEYCW